MTRRKDKQLENAFIVPTSPASSVWAVCDYCSPDCDAEGQSVVALFTDEEVAQKFADARGLPCVRSMHIYGDIKPYV